MQHRADIILKKGRDESVKRFHPWIFSGAIERISGTIQEGDQVNVLDHKGTYLATGHAATGSIAVKLFWFGPEKPPADLWYFRLMNALRVRERIGYTLSSNSNTYRLLFSEADGMPGVIIDYYNGVAVIQAHTMGMHLVRKELTDTLIRIYGDKLNAVYSKSSETLSRSGIYGEKDEFLYKKTSDNGIKMIPPEQELIVTENGRRFHIDFIEGQKTGFFLDQRENRALLSHYAPGMKILNVFSYSGGFSIYGLTAGAQHVTSLDSSAKAMVLLEKNLLLNTFEGSHLSVTADAKAWLPGMEKDFDIVVLDPPAFAKRQADRHKALQGYRFINQAAIKNIKNGGLLFTFSCSQAITPELFTSAVMSASINAGRNVRILHHLTHSPDHPVSIFHPEGEYLKGLVLMVTDY